MGEAAHRGLLAGTRIVSLALNLPGPAALSRLAGWGAHCVKIVPPAGDPLRAYSARAHEELHHGIEERTADLKTPRGQACLERELGRARLLLTSFRPSALCKLGIDWPQLQERHPHLGCVRIVGGRGEDAEVAGHDLTYMAAAGLVDDSMPPTLYADMAGALMTVEAALGVLHAQERQQGALCVDVALDEAAQWLGRPRNWGLTGSAGVVGGAHAGYRLYDCADGRIAVAALEPHFARRLLTLAGCPDADPLSPQAHLAVEAFLWSRSRVEIDQLAVQQDIPLACLPASHP